MAGLTFDTVIVSPDEVVFEGKCERLLVPGVIQDLSILPNHTPIYAQLKKGTIITYLPNGVQNQFPIESGIMRVKRNRVSVLIGFETRETVFKS